MGARHPQETVGEGSAKEATAQRLSGQAPKSDPPGPSPASAREIKRGVTRAAGLRTAACWRPRSGLSETFPRGGRSRSPRPSRCGRGRALVQGHGQPETPEGRDGPLSLSLCPAGSPSPGRPLRGPPESPQEEGAVPLRQTARPQAAQQKTWGKGPHETQLMEDSVLGTDNWLLKR